MEKEMFIFDDANEYSFDNLPDLPAGVEADIQRRAGAILDDIFSGSRKDVRGHEGKELAIA